MVGDLKETCFFREKETAFFFVEGEKTRRIRDEKVRSEKLARIEYCTAHTFRVFLKGPQLEAPVLKRRLHQRYLHELK